MSCEKLRNMQSPVVLGDVPAECLRCIVKALDSGSTYQALEYREEGSLSDIRVTDEFVQTNALTAIHVEQTRAITDDLQEVPYATSRTRIICDQKN